MIAERLNRIAREMRQAIYMSRLLRVPRVFFLLCSPIVLAGCQGPLAPSVAGTQPARMDLALADTDAPVRVGYAIQSPAPAVEATVRVSDLTLPEIPKPKDVSPVAAVKKEPECATVQLGDAFLHLLKTFTGH